SMFSTLDNDLSRYQLGYGVTDETNPATLHVNEGDLSHDPVYPGADVSYFNGLPFNFQAAHNFVAVYSIPRGEPSGVDSLSMNELSAGIVSATKSSKTTNGVGSNSSRIGTDAKGTYSQETAEWSRFTINQLSSSSAGNLTVNSNSSNPSLLFSASSSPSTSLPVFASDAALSQNIPRVISAATGSSSAPVMNYMMTNQNYLLVHSQQHPSHQQQQHHQQPRRQQQITPADDSGNYYMAFSSNDYQGLAFSNHPSASYPQAQYTHWSTTQLPVDSTPASTAITTSNVAWTNDAVGSAHMMHMQCTAASATPSSAATTSKDNCSSNDNAPHAQRQLQRPRQMQSQQLQIMTSLESGIASMYSQTTSTAKKFVPQQQQQSSIVSPVQHYPWGMAPSPVESCFTSDSSTPSFAPLSPSISYSNSDLGSMSCDSSRPTSPSFNQSGFMYEGYLLERRLHRQGSESSIIRSRKSSTSSTSSIVSQRRMSTLRESTTSPSSFSGMTTTTTTISSSPASTLLSSPTHQCPKCGQCFAGPAVLVRHIESIHDKLLWNCVGCKSNLSRRDAVTRHINLSPMDSVCRAVGTIGQIKMINGNEIQYEISSYRAKPLDEVMNRMGKKISTTLRKEIDLAKVRGSNGDNGSTVHTSSGGLEGLEEDEGLDCLGGRGSEDADGRTELEAEDERYGEDEDEVQQKKRRRSSMPTLARRKK
ncbi:hypothetical protein BGZ54_006555, partial [Gamsiella multidivaricata]